MITLDLRDSVALISLDRPEKLNALTREMLTELGEVFGRIELERNIRAVILWGAGHRAFSAVTDINELAGMNEEEARGAALRGQNVCALIESCSVPVIAAIGGLASGGGCELALACHIRIASDR